MDIPKGIKKAGIVITDLLSNKININGNKNTNP